MLPCDASFRLMPVAFALTLRRLPFLMRVILTADGPLGACVLR